MTTIEQARAVEHRLRKCAVTEISPWEAADTIASLIAELEAAQRDAALIGSACDKLRLMHSAEIKALSGIHRAELDAAQKDAARYRWFCEVTKWSEDIFNAIDTCNKEKVDAAIDAAMAAGETK